MIFGIIITSISMFLDSLFSNYIPISSINNIYLVPMFSIVSLIIIYPYFEEKMDFIKICLLFGFIYDILFTNTLGLNITLFFTIGYVITFLDDILSNTLFSIIIKMLVIILVYDGLSYFILLLLNYMNYDFNVLLLKYAKSILLNSIYIILLYFSTNGIAKKLSIKKSN